MSLPAPETVYTSSLAPATWISPLHSHDPATFGAPTSASVKVKSLLPSMVTSRKVATQATLALFELVTSPALIASPITIVFVVPNCVQVRPSSVL